MAIYLGETVQLKANFKDEDGTETDPEDGTVLVSLYDGQGTLLVTEQAGSKEGGTTSTYYYNHNISATANAGVFKHKWTATVGTFLVVEWRAFPVKGGLT